MTNDRAPFTAEEQGNQEETQALIPYEVYLPKMKKLDEKWRNEKIASEQRRRIRQIDVDVETLRAKGKLKPDETLIGVKVIEENIRKEQPSFVSYLTQSERLGVFDCQSTPGLNTHPLEIAFTKKMTYSGMIRQLVKTVDGAQTHGWDAVEVTYDPSKPGMVGVEHIGHEDLLFSWQARDAQADEFIMRRFKVTESQLKKWVTKYNFSSRQVENITAKTRDNDIPDPIEIFKVWIKLPSSVVLVGWVHIDESRATDWLKAPEPLDLGRRKVVFNTVIQDKMITAPDPTTGYPVAVPIQQPIQVPQFIAEKEQMFPIVLYIYNESEEQRITAQRGRVFSDRPWQDAQIALRTLTINGAIRSSNVYCSPKTSSATGARITILDLALEHGKVYSEPMEFWSPPYPDPAILRAADSLDTRKAAELGQTASAVINRDDARKTAKELQSAEAEQQKLALTPLMFFANFLREMLSLAWYIMQDQARQGTVLLVPSVQNPAVNDPTYIEQTYDIKPAGDPDVLRRQERIAREVNMLSIMQATPAWIEFLKDLIRDVLPERADKYIALIDMAEANKDQTIIALAGMLRAAVTDDSGAVKPEFAKNTSQLQQIFAQLPQAQNEPTSINQ